MLWNWKWNWPAMTAHAGPLGCAGARASTQRKAALYLQKHTPCVCDSTVMGTASYRNARTPDRGSTVMGAASQVSTGAAYHCETITVHSLYVKSAQQCCTEAGAGNRAT